MKKFFDITQDGADSIKNILVYFGCKIKNTRPSENYTKYFNDICKQKPKNPIIILFDNEQIKEKPLYKLINILELSKEKKEEKIEELNNNQFIHIGERSNLFLLTLPLRDGEVQCEIEDLFKNDVLNREINGKKFSKKDNFDTSKFYGKSALSQEIRKNYKNIDFEGFESTLNNIIKIMKIYNEISF